MDRRSFITLSVALAAAAAPQLSVHEAWAAGPEQKFIENMHRELQTAIRASKDPKSDPKLLAIFDRTLDYDYLTRETLGKHATVLTPEQRQEFDRVLKELVRASYRRNLKDPSGYAVDYTGQTPAKTATLVTTVTTNKHNKREKPLPVDYLVAKTGSAYLVQDVVTSGVSLVRNYRSQFGRIIKRKGFEALMELMHKRLAELTGD